MASPVFLALEMNKVDLRSKGNAFVRKSFSPLAAVILEASIFLFMWLWLCSSQLLDDKIRKFMYITSKVVVHICVMLVMALASCILLLIISMDKKFCLLLLLPFLLLTFLSSVASALRSEVDDANLHEEVKCEDELERSVDFTGSVTALVFLGLGRFAFEVDDPQKAHVGEHLAVAAVISFVICVLGVYFTLYGTIPLLPTMEVLENMINQKEARENVLRYLEWTNGLLAATVFGVVTWITWVIMKQWACLLFFPLLASLFAGLYKILISRDNQHQQSPQGSELKKPDGTSSAESKHLSTSTEVISPELTTATSNAQPRPSITSGEARPAYDEKPKTSSSGETRPRHDETTMATSTAKPRSSTSSAETSPASDETPKTSSSGEAGPEHEETTTAMSTVQPRPSTSSAETKPTPNEKPKTSSSGETGTGHEETTTAMSTAQPRLSTSSADTRPASDEKPKTSSSAETGDKTTAATSTAQPRPSTSSVESRPEFDQKPKTSSSGESSGEAKAAPLELTKATFTAFLLVAIPSFGDDSIQSCTYAFIFLTAAALVSGLLSRLLTHRTNPPQAVVMAANVASFFAHLCLVPAVISFTLTPFCDV